MSSILHSIARRFTARNILIMRSDSGLANRLLVIAGGMRIAGLLNRTLRIFWPVNQEMKADFHHLFSTSLPLCTPEEYQMIINTSVNKYYKPYEPIRRDDDADVIICSTFQAPALEGEIYEEVEAQSVFLRKLKPVPAIQKRINAVVFPPGPVIGVHVRRGGFMDQAKALDNFARSSDEHFIAVMKTVLERFPDAHFFLASDSARTEEHFRTIFGDRIITFPKTAGPRLSVEEVEEAVIDLFLLARTQVIIGTHWSTFGRTAALIGEIECINADSDNAAERVCARLEGVKAA